MAKWTFYIGCGSMVHVISDASPLKVKVALLREFYDEIGLAQSRVSR